MDFKKYLEIATKEIEENIQKYLADWEKEVKKSNPKLTPFVQSLINSTKGGKRIRGSLVKLGYELTQSVIPDLIGDPYNIDSRFRSPRGEAGGNDKGGNDIFKIGAAFEILHAALLIHDDIMDQSPTRRGQPSVYKALGGNHYGISQAINIGDLGLYLPIKIIADSYFPAKYKLKALSYFSQMVINTGLGQILDVERLQGGNHLTEGDIEFININKTAKYTIAGPLQIGAILAGGEQELVEILGEFGENLGIAFQIQDDILDREVQSVDQSKTKALEYMLEAKKVIPDISKHNKMSILLNQLAEYLIERNK